ncbi:twin BRCT domain-containing protein [Elsinoe fawcettii]|nr:twin BRCT domain-containing protein [Elsinoe fawcettii]
MAESDAQKPLYGVVICGTSLDQAIRSKVAPIAAELGATHKLDLTSDITHLLCASIASEKYRHVARHRPDIHVLRPEWLFAIRDAWITGAEVDVKGITHQFRLPTFHSLNICVTGFNDVKQRQWLQTTTTNNGAKYHGDLTKEVSHLVTAKPEGAKYERAKVWGIKLVSFEWFQRCADRGMILDESCFDPLLPPEQQGKGSYEPRMRKSESGKRLKAEDDDTQNSKRKMRRTASTRLNSQSQTLWADLSVTEDSAPPPIDDSWTQSIDPGKDLQQTVKTQPVQESDNKSRPSLSRKESSEKVGRGLFSGWACTSHGHDSPNTSGKLRLHLIENGAEVVDTIEALEASEAPCKALILPADWTARSDPQVPEVSQDIKLLTEWWVERCIVHKKALHPESDVLSNSFVHLAKDFFKDTVISTSGMGNDVRYIATLVKAAGGQYSEDLVRNTTILIHNTSKDDLEKPVYCAERNIDVVKPEWFLDSLRQRELQAVYSYYLPDSICDAIHQIRESRRKANWEQAQHGAKSNGGEVQHVREVRKAPPARLTGFKRQSRRPALPLMKTAPPTAPTTQPINRPSPLGEISQNSQERPRSQPTTVTLEDDPIFPQGEDVPSNLDGTRDKENIIAAKTVKPEQEPDSRRKNSTNDKDMPVNHVEGPVPPDASEFVSNFLARRQNSGSASLERPQARVKRKLGRAPSGSTTTSFVKPNASPFVEDDSLVPSIQEPPEPSQQITYDAPGAAEHRRIMSRRMGTSFGSEAGRRVENIGVVKDIDSGKAVGERVRGRHRDVR